MGVPLIREILTGDSKEIRDLATNEAALVGFLTLAKGIDDQPDIDMRFYEASGSLYQVTLSGRPTSELVEILSQFFGTPVKAPGKSLPVSLRFDPTVKYLGGIRKEQTFFLKKLTTGAFYGALWPWQRDPGKIEVLLGFCSPSMSDADYDQLGTLVKRFLSKKKIETVSEVGGKIHGISLPSFLQMSEMEGATYTLKVTSGNRSGYLYLDGGCLIAAQVDGQTGNAAAYRIISWDNAAIQIEAADADRIREIHDPLMHVMMESLKIKDEAGDDRPPAPPSPQESVPPAKLKSAPSADSVTVEKETQPLEIVPRHASTPVGTQPSEKAGIVPPQPGFIESESFEKATDRSAGKQVRKSMSGNVLIVLSVLVVFSILVIAGGKLLQERQGNRHYDQLIANLTATKELDAQIVLLLHYIQAYPEDRHRSELEARLKGAYTEIERFDYDKTLLDVSRLPMDEQFEKKALSLYTAFLTKYPQGIYVKQINEAIDGIQQLLGSAYFEALKKDDTTDLMERLTAYRSYLAKFPQGMERAAVERMIGDLEKEYTGVIDRQIATCNAQEKWDDCIAMCNRFLTAFTNDALVADVKMKRAMLQDKKELAELIAKAGLAADDFAKAKKIYTDYLETRPQSTQRKTIDQLINDLNADLSRQALWKKTAVYATNPANDIFSRIRRLDMFVENPESGPYATLARNLKTQLETELQDAIRNQRIEVARNEALARKQDERERRAKESQRIKRLRDQVTRQLQPVASRFIDHKNGTVTDRVTGLTWCLLDSYLDLGKCISHQTARDYVNRLNTGGRSDWRFPTASELAAIYKNRPFFPGTGAAWYWTSESYARGFHRVVDVVTSVPETVFMRTSKSVDSCGAVRAVHR